MCIGHAFYGMNSAFYVTFFMVQAFHSKLPHPPLPFLLCHLPFPTPYTHTPPTTTTHTLPPPPPLPCKHFVPASLHLPPHGILDMLDLFPVVCYNSFPTTILFGVRRTEDRHAGICRSATHRVYCDVNCFRALPLLHTVGDF